MTGAQMQAAKRTRVSRFAAAHNPSSPPHFNIYHGLIFAFLAALLFGQQRLPGIMADVASYPLGDWKANILTRFTVLFLMGYAMLGVRGLHPLMYVAMIAVSAGVGLRMGDVRISHEPISFSLGLLLFGAACMAVRVIVRQPDPKVEGRTW